MTSKAWAVRALGDFCHQVSDRARESDLPVLSVSKDLGIVLQSEKFKKRIASNDTANYKRVRFGQFVYDPMLLWAGNVGRQRRIDEGIVSPAYTVFETSDEIDDDYLEHFLKRPEMLDAYKLISRGTNVRRQKALFADFAALKFPFPPRDQQKKIAAILSSVDHAIEGTQAVIDQLQVVKKATMAELLTRGLPGRHTRFKQTEIGEVPEGWDMTTVGELGKFTGGNGFRPPDWSTVGLPIIRIQNLNGSTEFNYYAKQPDPVWLVEPGALLFAWAGTRGASFGPCIWPGPLGLLNQHIYRITPIDSVRKKFLYYVLRLLTEAVEKKAHGFKDTLVHLRKAELTGWTVALPPLDEQDQIVSVVTASEERLSAEELRLDALRAVKSALSSALLTGELRVTPDEATP
jgi:type I restriction enzyme S subunit